MLLCIDIMPCLGTGVFSDAHTVLNGNFKTQYENTITKLAAAFYVNWYRLLRTCSICTFAFASFFNPKLKKNSVGFFISKKLNLQQESQPQGLYSITICKIYQVSLGRIGWPLPLYHSTNIWRLISSGMILIIITESLVLVCFSRNAFNLMHFK